MTQLSKDCFASGAPIRSVDDAVASITTHLRPVDGVEVVALTDADGRILARDLIATLQLPPFTNSAVDGYAVRGQDVPVDTERAFGIAGRLQAGASAAGSVAPGEAIASSPVRQCRRARIRCSCRRTSESTRPAGRCAAGLKRGANVRPAGEDITLGRVILPAGRWLRPQDVAAAAAMGLTEIEVRRRVRVAVFSNGDEIVEPGAVRGEAQLFDSNRFMLLAMLRRIGCEVSDLGIRRDEREEVAMSSKEPPGSTT